MQAHLYADRPLDIDGLENFMVELGKLGLDVEITELDVIDWKLPADPATRDRAAASLVGTFLTRHRLCSPAQSHRHLGPERPLFLDPRDLPATGQGQVPASAAGCRFPAQNDDGGAVLERYRRGQS